MLIVEGQVPISKCIGSVGRKSAFYTNYRKDTEQDGKSREGFGKEHDFCMVLKCFPTDYLFIAKEKLVVILYSNE